MQWRKTVLKQMKNCARTKSATKLLTLPFSGYGFVQDGLTFQPLGPVILYVC